MTGTTLMQKNGSIPFPSQNWLQLSTQTFFRSINWEDHPPAVQELKLTAAESIGLPLSLTLSVSQFLEMVNWEGSAIAPSTPFNEFPAPALKDDLKDSITELTLEDLSDLF